MTNENKRANVAEEIETARRHRDAANRIAAIGEYEAAVNRLYFSALHAVKAVCFTEGLEPKSHRGLKHLLSLHFTSKGALPAWIDSTLGQLETERDLVDYAVRFAVSPERYEERRVAADRLLGEIEAYLRARGFLSI